MNIGAMTRLAIARFADPLARTGYAPTTTVSAREDGSVMISCHVATPELEASTVITLRGSALAAFDADATHHDIFTAPDATRRG